jgi:hypothetical protein
LSDVHLAVSSDLALVLMRFMGRLAGSGYDLADNEVSGRKCMKAGRWDRGVQPLSGLSACDMVTVSWQLHVGDGLAV